MQGLHALKDNPLNVVRSKMVSKNHDKAEESCLIWRILRLKERTKIMG